ncbi:hypothetical protein M885DRAFT_510866 [Pelagophyceae sp. CCMP2097]|nr:hypothetical protein M885DRAFT_510866 [Pelagophyceae sp. CCMP2097]
MSALLVPGIVLILAFVAAGAWYSMKTMTANRALAVSKAGKAEGGPAYAAPARAPVAKAPPPAAKAPTLPGAWAKMPPAAKEPPAAKAPPPPGAWAKIPPAAMTPPPAAKAPPPKMVVASGAPQPAAVPGAAQPRRRKKGAADGAATAAPRETTSPEGLAAIQQALAESDGLLVAPQPAAAPGAAQPRRRKKGAADGAAPAAPRETTSPEDLAAIQRALAEGDSPLAAPQPAAAPGAAQAQRRKKGAADGAAPAAPREAMSPEDLVAIQQALAELNAPPAPPALPAAGASARAPKGVAVPPAQVAAPPAPTQGAAPPASDEADAVDGLSAGASKRSRARQRAREGGGAGADEAPKAAAAAAPKADGFVVVAKAKAKTAPVVDDGFVMAGKAPPKPKAAGRVETFVLRDGDVNLLEGCRLYHDVIDEGLERRLVKQVDSYIARADFGQDAGARAVRYGGPVERRPGFARRDFQAGPKFDDYRQQRVISAGDLVDGVPFVSEPMPSVAADLAAALARKRIAPADEQYDIFLANNYEAGQFTAMHTDAKYIQRPLIVTTLLSPGEIVFGRQLTFDAAAMTKKFVGKKCAHLTVTLPPRSTLVLTGPSADVAQHAINTVAQRRISILLRKTIKNPNQTRPSQTRQ